MQTDIPVSDRLIESPAGLVAILVAARRAGDRELERLAKAELQDRYAMRISFARPTPPETTGATQ